MTPACPCSGPCRSATGADQPAEVELVVEDAGATGDMAADRSVAPLPPMRAGHALVVEPPGDHLGAHPGGVLLEDPADDPRPRPLFEFAGARVSPGRTQGRNRRGEHTCRSCRQISVQRRIDRRWADEAPARRSGCAGRARRTAGRCDARCAPTRALQEFGPLQQVPRLSIRPVGLWGVLTMTTRVCGPDRGFDCRQVQSRKSGRRQVDLATE